MIIRWTVTVPAARQVGRNKKFELFFWGVTESWFGEDSPQIVLIVDLPINSANWNSPLLFEWIDVDTQYEVNLVLNFEPCHGPDWNIQGFRRDVVSSVINAGFKFKERKKLVSGPVRERKFSGHAGDRIRIDAVRTGEIISFRINSELKIVFVEQMDVAQSFDLVVINRLRSKTPELFDLASEGVI